VSDYRAECSALERRLERLQQRGTELERAASAALEEARALRELTPVAEARALTPAPAAPETPTASGKAPDSSPSAPAAGALPAAITAAQISGEASAPAEETRFPPGALLAGLAFLGIAVNGAGTWEAEAEGPLATTAPGTARSGSAAVGAAPTWPTDAGVTETPAAKRPQPPTAVSGNWNPVSESAPAAAEPVPAGLEERASGPGSRRPRSWTGSAVRRRRAWPVSPTVNPRWRR
jgi:hypothetical protein